MVAITAMSAIEGKYDLMPCGHDLVVRKHLCFLSGAVIE